MVHISSTIELGPKVWQTNKPSTKPARLLIKRTAIPAAHRFDSGGSAISSARSGLCLSLSHGGSCLASLLLLDRFFAKDFAGSHESVAG
jgi:hypothetical protein